MKYIPLLFVLSIFSSFASAQSAKEIMETVDRQQRKANDRTFTKVSLSTCKFAVKNGRPVCSEMPRQKIIETVQKNYGDDGKDSKSISIVLEPASEKGIGMLTYSYGNDEKDTESWLYLSALGKVKRMVSGGKEEQEPVAFFGSEFTTEDMENGKTDEYTYTILEEGNYSGTKVWVIESVPSEKRLKKTRYSKSIAWIDQEKMVVLKTQSYDKRGDLAKKMMSSNFVDSNGIWKALETTMYNMKDNRMSAIINNEIAPDVNVNEEFLTQRSLTDFAFREANLSELRKGSIKTP